MLDFFLLGLAISVHSIGVHRFNFAQLTPIALAIQSCSSFSIVTMDFFNFIILLSPLILMILFLAPPLGKSTVPTATYILSSTDNFW